MNLKKIADQVIVITGASSGIGLTTARMAAEQGAKLVLVARDQDALERLAEELRQQGCDALAVAADVGMQEDIQRVGDRTIERQRPEGPDLCQIQLTHPGLSKVTAGQKHVLRLFERPRKHLGQGRRGERHDERGGQDCGQ